MDGKVAIVTEAGRRIVNTSSGVGLTPHPGNPMYVAAKAGVAALIVSCAIELAELGVTQCRTEGILHQPTPEPGRGAGQLTARAGMEGIDLKRPTTMKGSAHG
jgi:NAD(P)-dependent dehydrogenase (short-subunit alcohol dehydrogenase family)